ncbi:Bromodomain-containing protein [Cokeromyces recurvatus]|uniref:Bromodomain-containing protein n=1 Tax=Cokeromyces recurvatus TaxID=90255 RepID=UPI00222107B7|nr:Bromodomain-containing protein [Cokeromyces recurvatus]KAI7901743.1 Bromodomain-containing protein [Cokeromyces recurvatus]
MDVDIKLSPKQIHQEEFEEIDTTLNRPKIELKENVSLLDRGKSNKKQSRTNSLSPSTTSKSNMTRDQIKYCGAIMRNLKKHRDAAPFLHPVDYVKLNVPDYPKIIKYPMDLMTVDQKLMSAQYDAVEEFINDIRLIFNNCYKFNGPEAMISMLCQNVESAFEKSLRQMPPSKDSATPRSMSPFFDDDHDKIKRRKNNIKTNENKSSLSTHMLRRASEESRPKREVHPPPSKDYPEPILKRRNNNNNPRKNDLQMKFCAQTLKELKKNKYRDINYPFLAPVDVVALNIPDYVDIIKHPMDLSTIERKLNEGDYEDPKQFEQDIRLMFNNCYTYNPPNLPVYKMGRELEKVFDEKWTQRPSTPVPTPMTEEAFEDIQEEEEEEGRRRRTGGGGGGVVVEEEEEEEDEEMGGDSDFERDQKIAELERHIATISQQIASIKSQKRRRSEKTIGRRQSKPTLKEKKPVKERKRRVTKKKERQQTTKSGEEFPEFTFDQKKDLSEQINNLTGERLSTVVNIIQSSMPNLNGQGQDEIVLDIDSLDRRTLHRLHEFVTGESLIHKNKRSSPTPKRPRTHYSERATDRKIRQLEETLQKFNSDNEESSSESDSDSSSGSESDDSASDSD